jgi:hypothetical protein
VSEPPLSAQIAVRDAISIARLHGMACIDCGAVTDDLEVAGQIELHERSWRVVACGHHIIRHKTRPGRAPTPSAQARDQGSEGP